MPSGSTLWTLRESHKHGLTRELLDAFRKRAEAEGIETVAALVRAMRQYIDKPTNSPTPNARSEQRD